MAEANSRPTFKESDQIQQEVAIGGNGGGVTESKNGTKGTRDPDSGWKLWGRVYEDPALRSRLNDRIKDAPTVEEIFKNEKLVRAQLVFTNVPRLGVSTQKVVRALIESECGGHMAIFDIIMKCKTWRVRFFREEDAARVLKVFNGYSFRDHKLSVRYDPADVKGNDIVKQAQDSESDKKTQPVVGSRKGQCVNPGNNNTWSCAENRDLDAFKSNLVDILKEKDPRTSHGLPVDKIGCILLKKPLPFVIQSALSVWPIGLYRMCAPQVQLAVGFLNLQSNNDGIDADDVNVESGVYCEKWEPMAPSMIHTAYHLTEYVEALLRVFGPQNGDVNLPWRMFTSVLPVGYGWPQDSNQLMQLVASHSPKFCLFGGTLYLLSDMQHRYALSEQTKLMVG